VTDFQGCQSGGLWAGGFATTNRASFDCGLGWPLTLTQVRVGLAFDLSCWRVRVVAGLEGLWAVRVDTLSASVGWKLERVLGPLDREARRRLRPIAEAAPVRHRLGTAGRPGSERLMRLPRRMCPLGKGTVAWLSFYLPEPEAKIAERL
jgi:hypothetical protein